MTRIDDIDTALRSLDPADRHIDPTSARAHADLHTILATTAPPLPGTPLRHRQGRPARRLALAGVAAAALTAALVTLPALTGGDQAFATWTATPTPVPAREQPEAAADCRTRLSDGAGPEYSARLANAEVAVAESRGVWTTVLLAGPDGFSALCTTDDSTHLFDDRMIGSMGVTTLTATPGPRDLQATVLGTGTIDGSGISLAAGESGSDITGIQYRSTTYGTVTATVSNGYFALWLPGTELENTPSNGLPGEVAYRDGTTATVLLTLGN